MDEKSRRRRECAGDQEQSGDNLQTTVQMLVRDQAEIHPVPAALFKTVLLAVLVARDQPVRKAGVGQNDIKSEEGVKRASWLRMIWLPLSARYRNTPAKSNSAPWPIPVINRSRTGENSTAE